MKKTEMPNPAKSHEYITCYTAPVVPDLVKALTILSVTTITTSAVDQEDLKPYWKSEKRPYFSRSSTFLLFTSFSDTLLITERRLIGGSF